MTALPLPFKGKCGHMICSGQHDVDGSDGSLTH